MLDCLKNSAQGQNPFYSVLLRYEIASLLKPNWHAHYGNSKKPLKIIGHWELKLPYQKPALIFFSVLYPSY